MKKRFFTNVPFFLVFAFLAIFAAAMSGCGGGGGSSSTSTGDNIGPIVATIEGKIYVPANVSASPKGNAAVNSDQNSQTTPVSAQTGSAVGGAPSATGAASTQQVQPVSGDAGNKPEDQASQAPPEKASEISVPAPPMKAVTINPREGYIPLSGANVTLSGTNKAVVTNTSGYFKFEIGQYELPKTETKKIVVSKPESNVNIEFEVRVSAGENKYISTEVDTRTGERAVKEILTNKQQSPFIYVSGKVTSATGSAISNAIVDMTDETTLTKVTPNLIPYPVTDALGRYEIAGLIDGHTYTMTVMKENYKPFSKSIIVSSSYTLSNIDFIVPGTFDVSKRTLKPGVTDMKITYTTSVPTTYTMYYGPTQQYAYTLNPSSATYSKTTDIIVSNLSPKTLYNYKLTIVDQYGNAITTDNATFETLDPAAYSTVAPTINPNYTVVKTYKSITVNFSTNTSAYGQVKYSTGSLAPSYSVELGPQTNFTIMLDNLLNNTTYKLNLIAKNILNKENVTEEPRSPSTITVTTDNSPDRKPPLLTNIKVKDIKAREATITWDASDSHENIFNNTDATVYFDTFSYPYVEYDKLTDPPQPKLKDRYGSASATQTFTRNSAKSVTLTGLTYSTKYYFRPSSNDPSGNIGTSTNEASFASSVYMNAGTSGEGVFTTAAPGTELTFTLDESPSKGQISVGEDAKIMRMKLTGSTEENLVVNKIVFSQVGNISYNSIDELKVSDGINTWKVERPISSSIEVTFANPGLSIPKNNSIYLTANVKLNSAALSTTNDTKSVVLLITQNNSNVTTIDVSGDVYGNYIKDKIKGVPLSSSAQDINVGQLKLTPVTTDLSSADYQSSTQTVLVNKGMTDVLMFKFKVEAQYEDIDITQIQLSQTGTAVKGLDYSDVTIYDGINALGSDSSASNNNAVFQSNTSLLKVPKGSTSDKTKVITVVASIRADATDSRYVQFKIDTVNLIGVGNFSKQTIRIIGANDQATGNSPIVGSKYMIGDNALLVSAATDSPTKQVFKLGETNRTFTIFKLSAGSAEEIQIDTVELTFNGTSPFTNTALYVTDENNTVIFQTANAGALINSTTKKLTFNPSNFIMTRGTTRKIYVKGDISSSSSEVGKTIQIGLSSAGAIKGHGVQTGEKKSSDGTAIPPEPHSIVGTVVLAPVLPQPSYDLLAGSAKNNFLMFKITPAGETLEVQNISFTFTGSYSILDKLKVIDPTTKDTTTNESVEIAINPAISGSTLTFTPSLTTVIPPAGKTFWIIGDISNSANSTNTLQFTIPSSGISIKGQSSGQVYKTQENVTGNTLKIVAEAFYLSSASSASSVTALTIGDATTQEVLAFRFEAKPRTSYYISKIILRQIGSATFGSGQDFMETDFDFYVESTRKNAQITISGSDLNINFASTTDVLIDATSQTSVSSYLNCYLKCKPQKTAIKGKTLQFYVDNALVTANSTTLKTQLSGTGSVTGNTVTLRSGSLKAMTRGDNPGSSMILNSNEKDYLSLTLTSEVEALEVREIKFNMSVSNGSSSDFDSSSLVVRVYDSANALKGTYQGSNVTVSGNIYSVVPYNGVSYLSIPKDDFVKVLVSGKANFSSAQNGSQISFRLANDADVMTVGAVSGQTIYSTGIITGNYMTIQKTAATLTVSSRSDTPVAQALANNAVTDMFSFDITSNNVENMDMSKIVVTLEGLLTDFDQTQISAKIYDNTTLVGTYSGPGVSGTTFTFNFAPAVTIPKNSTRKIIISGAKLATAAAGNQFRLKVAAAGDIIATGQTSASTIASTGTVTGNIFTVTALAAPTISVGPAGATVSGYPNDYKVTWTTSEFTDSKVQYGTTAGGPYPFTASDASMLLSHSMTLTGLTTGTTYYYVVSSKDDRNNIVTSAEQNFSLTSLKKGYLDAELVTADPAISTNVAVGTRFLVAKISLKNKKDSTYGDDARISSMALSAHAANTFPIGSITKLELTDGQRTFTVSSPTAFPVTFSNMNYIVPQPSVNNAVTTMATLSLYATVSQSTGASDYNKVIRFQTTPRTDIIARGALYNSDINADTTLSNVAAGTAGQTVDVGKIVASDDAATNGGTGSNASPGDLNVLLLGFNLKNERTGDAAYCPEDIVLKTVKVSNAGTGSLATDISNVKLYDETNNLLANGVVNSGFIEFTSTQLYTMTKGNTATKNFKIYGDVPQNATLGKTVKLQLLAGTNVSATNSTSNTTPSVNALTVTGKEYLIGQNSITVTLDPSSPTAANYVPDGTERLAAVFKVSVGAAEGVNLSSTNFEFDGNTPLNRLTTVRLYDGSRYHTLTNSAGNTFTTSNAISLTAGATYLFSIYVTVASAVDVPLTYIRFKMNTAPAAVLTGTGTSSGRTVNSSNGVPTPVSNNQTAIGKVLIESDPATPSGNLLIGDTGSGNGVPLFSFKLTPSVENGKFESVRINLSSGSFTTDIDSNINTLKLYESGIQRATAVSVSGNYVTFNNLSSIGAAAFNNMVAGTTYTYTLYGNLRTTSTKDSSVSFKVESSSDVTATGVTSAQSLSVSGTSTGNTLTTTNGAISVALASTINAVALTDTKELVLERYNGSATPLLINNSNGMLVVAPRVTATNVEDVKITEIKLNILGDISLNSDFGAAPGYGFWIDDDDNLANGTTVTGFTVTNNGGNVVTLSKSGGLTTITKNTSKNIVIGLLPKVASSTVGRQARISIQTGWIKGQGATSTKEFTSTGNINYDTDSNTYKTSTQTIISGKMSASADSSVTAKTILKGKDGEEIAKFNLTSALSSNGNQVEDITMSRITIKTSADMTNFKSAPTISIDGGAPISRNAGLSNNNTHVYDVSTTLLKSATQKQVSVVASIAGNASAISLYASVLAADTKGTGYYSSQNITCSGGDSDGEIKGPIHTIGSSQYTASLSSTDNPSSNFITLSTATPTEKVMSLEFAADNEHLYGQSMAIRYDGTVNPTAITEMKVQDSLSVDLLVAVANPFATTGATYTATYTTKPLVYMTSASPKNIIRVLLKFNSNLINDGDYVKLTVASGGAVAKGITSSSSYTSVNEVSNTMYFQKSMVAFTTNSYSTGTYQPGDTGKTLIDFKISAGKYQSVDIKKLRVYAAAINDDPSQPYANNSVIDQGLAYDLTNFKLYVDGQFHSNINTATDIAGANFTISLSPAVTITKGSSRSFKIIADVANLAVNQALSGRYIHFVSRSSDYDNANDFSPALPDNSNKSGTALGNAHKITRYGTLTVSQSSYSPSSATLTLDTITNLNPGGAYGNIAIFELTVGPSAGLLLSKIRTSYSGTTMNDVPSNGLTAYVHTDVLNLMAGTNFTIGTFDTTNKIIEFNNAGMTLNANTKYYAGIYTKVNSTAVLGHFVKLDITANDTNISTPNGPFNATAAGGATVEDIKFSGNVTSNQIFIDSPEVNVVVRCTDVPDISLDLPYIVPVSEKKVMQIDMTNSNASTYTLEKMYIDMKMYSSAVVLNNMKFKMRLYELTGNPVETYITESAQLDLANALYTVPMNGDMPNTYIFTLTPPADKQAFAKGQTRRFVVKLNSDISAYSDGSGTLANPNYGGGNFSSTWAPGCYPYVLFAINNDNDANPATGDGMGIQGSFPSYANKVIKGTQFNRIPSEASKKFFFRSQQ